VSGRRSSYRRSSRRASRYLLLVPGHAGSGHSSVGSSWRRTFKWCSARSANDLVLGGARLGFARWSPRGAPRVARRWPLASGSRST
jgi:hypothetical protein